MAFITDKKDNKSVVPEIVARFAIFIKRIER